MSRDIKTKLITLLSDGKFHSGEELGQSLQVTRSAIWKIIPQLTQLGIEIHSVKGKGYCIPNGIELLSVEKIKNILPSSIQKEISLQIVNEVDSTNQYLLDNGRMQQGAMILAEYQHRGKGRRARKWFSPFGANIYFSVRWTFDKDPGELSGLSLAIGVAVANTLERLGIRNVQLKWPNDVLWNYKKIAGILLEMTSEINSTTNIIIGIGINVRMPEKPNIDQEWIDIVNILGKKISRNTIAAYLIEEVIQVLITFQKTGFEKFCKHWQALDAFYDVPVVLSTPTQEFAGIAKGITRQGEFQLQTPEKKELRFLHGEVSLRRKETF